MSSITTMVADQYCLQEWTEQIKSCQNRPDLAALYSSTGYRTDFHQINVMKNIFVLYCSHFKKNQLSLADSLSSFRTIICKTKFQLHFISHYH